MIIQVDDTLAIEVSFAISNREIGYADDICVSLCQSGSSDSWLFPSTEVSFLLTADQAEKLSVALKQAAEESRLTPRQ
jgi:hypothetical protein